MKCDVGMIDRDVAEKRYENKVGMSSYSVARFRCLATRFLSVSINVYTTCISAYIAIDSSLALLLALIRF